jgi:DNA-binding transcriptional MerR regulator
MTKQLLTVSGLSMETRVPEQTIRRWLRKGLINYLQDSAGRRLFDEVGLAQAIKLRDRDWYGRRGFERRRTVTAA